MIDVAEISVSSGSGGDGVVSGRREKYIPHGGPDGGDGGRGGNIYIRSDRNINSLLRFRYEKKFAAGSGGNGSGRNKRGRDGGDAEIGVPVGTEIFLLGDGEPRMVADLSEDGERIVIAKGGVGGRGNARFVSPRRRFPLLAEAGGIGKNLRIRLEMKILADVGVIGVPNVGKSSLLASVSAAKPRIANYPFTTLEPVLGVVEHQGIKFTMVDIPGLIEGASRGAGLGYDFLRHVERTRVIVHVLDGTSENPMDDFSGVMKELKLHGEHLSKKPQVVAVNKMDIEGVPAAGQKIKVSLMSEVQDVVCISAVRRKGLGELLGAILKFLNKSMDIEEERTGKEKVPLISPRRTRETPHVTKVGGERYQVSMPAAERLAAMIDSNNWSARMQLYEQFHRLGVISALESAGISPGQFFRVGQLEWEWE